MINDSWALWPWNIWKCLSKYARKCYGFPRAHLPFLPIIWRDLPKTCLRQLCVSVRRKMREKTDGATLSGRTIFLSIEAKFSVRILFLPHILAAERWRHHEGKKAEKGHATLCGRTGCSIVLSLQRLRRNLRHIIWRKSAMI